uniref:CSD domain-containing protein n=1 Tax=Strigamia maritima TaxID=126957 RepID=T1JBT8_STRMM
MSSSPMNAPQQKTATTSTHSSSPIRSPTSSSGRLFYIPSPIITKRTRTYSACERAIRNPTETGKVKYFCRQKGHGFITPSAGGNDIFVHISDIDGEVVPLEGDEVRYKLCPMPPKNEGFQAIHVEIMQLSPAKHQKWDDSANLHCHISNIKKRSNVLGKLD